MCLIIVDSISLDTLSRSLDNMILVVKFNKYILISIEFLMNHI